MSSIATAADSNRTGSALPKEVVPPATRGQVAALVAAIVILFAAANVAARFLLDRDSRNLGYWLVHDKWSRLLALDHPVDWLILGDSSGNHGVMPSLITERLGGSAINLCTVGNLIAVNDVWMLEQYLQRFGPPRHVIVVHVYDVWHRPLERGLVAKIPLPWGFWQKLDPRVTFPPRELVSLFTDRYVPLYSQNLSLADLIEHPRAQPIGPIRMQDDGFMVTTMTRPEAVAREAEGHRETSRGPLLSMTDQNRAALVRLGALAEQYDFDAFLANSPLYDGLYQDPTFRGYYKQTIDEVRRATEANPRVHYLLQEPVTMPIDQLQGVDHVTSAGASVYTSALASAIETSSTKMAAR